MNILVKMLNSAGVEGRGSSDDTVDLVSLAEKELYKVRAVLASDTYGKQGNDKKLYSARHKWQEVTHR